MKLSILVIYGSVREHRQGIRATRFIVRQLEKHGHDPILIDPLEYDFSLLDKMYKEYDKAPEKMEALAKIIKKADAFVFVTAEYNHSFPPALKNIIDHYLEEWFWRPSAIVSYSAGSFGGVRAAAALRPVLGEIGTVSIPSTLPIPKVHDQFDEDGTPNDEETWDRRATKWLDELEWYAEALKKQRETNDPPY